MVKIKRKESELSGLKLQRLLGGMDKKQKERREWYKSHKICPRCGKNEAFENHIHCAECLEKISLENSRTHMKNKGDIYSRRYVQKKRELRKKRREAGLCPFCGKPAVKGVFCLKHYTKNVERNERRRTGRTYGEKFRERMSAGLCMYCGKPQVSGYKFCEEHLPKMQKKGKMLSRSNDYARKEVNRQWEIAKLKHSENI